MCNEHRSCNWSWIWLLHWQKGGITYHNCSTTNHDIVNYAWFLYLARVFEDLVSKGMCEGVHVQQRFVCVGRPRYSIELHVCEYNFVLTIIIILHSVNFWGTCFRGLVILHKNCCYDMQRLKVWSRSASDKAINPRNVFSFQTCIYLIL